MQVLGGKLQTAVRQTGKCLLNIHHRHLLLQQVPTTCNHESQNVTTSHTKQQTNITEDKQAVRTSH